MDSSIFWFALLDSWIITGVSCVGEKIAKEASSEALRRYLWVTPGDRAGADYREYPCVHRVLGW